MKAINSESLGQWRQNAPSDIGDEKGVDIGKSEKTAVDRIGKGGLLASFIEHWALWIQICAMVAACLCLAPVDTFADEIDDDLAAQWTTQSVPAQMGERQFTTAHRFELGLNIGVVLTDDYYTYFPMEFDAGYRFTEMWGVRLRGSILMIHADSALSDFMDANQSSVAAQMLSDEQRGDIYAVATFHPFYGKWTAGTQNLGHFDWGISAGVGAVFSKTPNKSLTKRDLSAYAEGVFATDAHFFLLSWLALRIEAALRFYKTPQQWVVPASLSIGVSFFLPEIEVSK